MKKLVSIALSLSIFACSANILAVGENVDNNVEQKKQSQSLVQKKVLITGGVLAVCYGAYKIGDKTGLNKEIKTIIETKAFKNTLILSSGIALPIIFFWLLLW